MRIKKVKKVVQDKRQQQLLRLAHLQLQLVDSKPWAEHNI
jgi:hypothetical protein